MVSRTRSVEGSLRVESQESMFYSLGSESFQFTERAPVCQLRKTVTLSLGREDLVFVLKNTGTGPRMEDSTSSGVKVPTNKCKTKDNGRPKTREVLVKIRKVLNSHHPSSAQCSLSIRFS